MPLVHPLPPTAYVATRGPDAVPFHGDVLRSWARRANRMGATYWLHHGRLVSQPAIAAYGAHEAWSRAEPQGAA